MLFLKFYSLLITWNIIYECKYFSLSLPLKVAKICENFTLCVLVTLPNCSGLEANAPQIQSLWYLNTWSPSVGRTVLWVDWVYKVHVPFLICFLSFFFNLWFKM